MERTAQQLYRENLIQRFNDPDLQDFVQSTINILSDGIDIDDINGLKLESKGGNKKLISFYEKIKTNPLCGILVLGKLNKNTIHLILLPMIKPCLVSSTMDV